MPGVEETARAWVPEKVMGKAKVTAMDMERALVKDTEKDREKAPATAPEKVPATAQAQAPR